MSSPSRMRRKAMVAGVVPVIRPAPAWSRVSNRIVPPFFMKASTLPMAWSDGRAALGAIGQ